MAPPWGPPAALVQQKVIAQPLLMAHDTRGVVGLTTVAQQLPQSEMPFQAYANYAMGPPLVRFSIRVELGLWCLLPIFRFHCGCHIDLWGLNYWGLHHHSPAEHIHGRHMCIVVMV